MRSAAGVVALGLIGLAVGCGGGTTPSPPPAPPPPPPPPPPPSVATVELTGPATVLEAGGTLQLTATAKDASGATLSGQTVTWSSSAANVATVGEQGLVRGVSAGAATITATIASRSATLELSVRDTTTLPTSLAGRIDRVDLTLPAGQTYRVTGDLIIKADSNLMVAGRLELDPGVKVILFAGGTLTVSGEIEPASSNLRLPALRLQAAEDAATETVFGGQRVNLTGSVKPDGPIYVSGADTGPTNFSLVTIGPAADLFPLPARHGTADAKDGRPGHDVEIGTANARGRLGELSQLGGAIRRLRILPGSFVLGGAGGNGLTLQRADGTVANNQWEGAAGRGGNGGALAIDADELEVVSRSLVRAGRGGFGGGVRLDRLLDGSGPNGEGESLYLEGGFGGDGGALTVATRQVVAADGFLRARRGGTVGFTIVGGNGVEGGAGGDITLRVGEPGSDGTVSVPSGIAVAPDEAVPSPLVDITNAANGGDAVLFSRNGGAGGTIAVEGPEPRSIPKVAGIRIRNVAKGGRGYDGCRFNPFVNGTDGGPGGRLLSGGVPVDGGGDFNGGTGGGGLPNAGKGGAAGTHLDDPFGLVGLPGTLCPVLSVQPFQINIVADRPVGQCAFNVVAAGNLTVRNLVATPTRIVARFTNIEGAAGITIIPGFAPTGQGVAVVSETVPPNATRQVHYKFDPCVARDGGGDAKGEFRIEVDQQVWTIPTEVKLR